MKTYANFTRSQLLVYYFASFVGLAPFSVENDVIRPAGFTRKAYAVVLFALSSSRLLIASLRHGSDGTDLLSQLVYGTYVILLTGYSCSILVIFQFKSDKMVDIVNEITGIKEELKNLGVEDNSGKYGKKFFLKIASTFGVVLLMRVFNNILLDDRDLPIEFKTISWIGGIVMSIHCHSAILIFSETIICIGELFESLNNKLKGNVRPNRGCLSFDDPQNLSASRLGDERENDGQLPQDIITSENIQLTVGDVKKIGKLHGDLCTLVESTSRLHTVPILLATVQHFGRLLSNCYSLYTHVFMSSYAFESTEAYLVFMMRLVARTTVTILETFLIANACTSMSRAGNATKAIIHETWNKFYPEDLRNELVNFSLQLLHKPVAVSVFGFFDLDYSFVYKMFCATVAYLIFLVQFDTSQMNPGT